jgi:hypothetical protein
MNMQPSTAKHDKHAVFCGCEFVAVLRVEFGQRMGFLMSPQ